MTVSPLAMPALAALPDTPYMEYQQNVSLLAACPLCWVCCRNTMPLGCATTPVRCIVHHDADLQLAAQCRRLLCHKAK